MYQIHHTKNHVNFETTACLYAKQRYYTLCSPFITWKLRFYFHVWHGDVREEVVVLRTAATVEPEGLSSLVACSSYFLSFAIILCWRSFIISNSPASLLIQFLDDFLRLVLVSDFSRVTAFFFFTFREGFLDLLALLNRNYFVAKNQDSLNPLLLPLFLNRLKIRHYFLTLLGVWILRTTQKSYIFQNFFTAASDVRTGFINLFQPFFLPEYLLFRFSNLVV